MKTILDFGEVKVFNYEFPVQFNIPTELLATPALKLSVKTDMQNPNRIFCNFSPYVEGDSPRGTIIIQDLKDSELLIFQDVP